MATRLQIAKKDIFDFFENEIPHILKYKDIASYLESHRSFWRLAMRTNTTEFINFLSKSGKLSKVEFPFPNRKETRYTWGKQPLTDILLTLKIDSYFSHYTAMYMNGLTEQIPKVIYLNHEQKPVRYEKNRSITQEDIDSAFKRPPRITSNIAEYSDLKICLLNGQYTGNAGVISEYIMYSGEKVKVRLTNVERTLIDVTVRPSYAGGIFEVLKAYENAKETASINSMSAMLKKIDYIYPYHQAIGFYLERAGYSERDLNIIKKFPMKFDFYLTNQISKMEYVREWRLYVPAGF